VALTTVMKIPQSNSRIIGIRCSTAGVFTNGYLNNWTFSRTAKPQHGRSDSDWTGSLLELPETNRSGITCADREALASLYDRYGRWVFALAVRILNDPVGSEEVTQDVFMSVWRRGASYTWEKGKFTTWLFSIAHNRTIDELRKRRRDRSRDNDDIEDHYDLKSSDISPADAAVAQSEYAKVKAAMDNLPEEQ